jgi:hypothetical protein
MTTSWKRIGGKAPGALTPERLQLHYAAWVLGSVADSVLSAREDDSQSNLAYEPAAGRLVTRPLAEGGDLRLGLRLDDLALLSLAGDEQVQTLALPGETFPGALAWAGEMVGAPVRRREYPDFPASPLAKGAAFAVGDREARLELSRYFADSNRALQALAPDHPAMSEVRVWPHHFDQGAIVPVAEGKLIGLGFSPGDGSYDEPYFYVYPYPYPPADRLSGLETGSWHTEGFTAAVLTGSGILTQSDQEALVGGFLAEAMAACRSLLTDA